MASIQLIIYNYREYEIQVPSAQVSQWCRDETIAQDDSVNPRLTGSWEPYRQLFDSWRNRKSMANDGKGVMLINERLRCSRVSICCDEKIRNGVKKPKCDFNWRWVVYSNDLQNVYVERAGDHSGSMRIFLSKYTFVGAAFPPEFKSFY
jgi:hypothetical protein